MSFTVDKYLKKTFNLKTYNCWHFAREVWQELTGDELMDLTPENPSKTSCWLAVTYAEPRFLAIPGPESPCLVLMQRAEDIPHIGVYYKDKILHLRPQGVVWQQSILATAGFSKVFYYKQKVCK